jgi:hypothetical protein
VVKYYISEGHTTFISIVTIFLQVDTEQLLSNRCVSYTRLIWGHMAKTQVQKVGTGDSIFLSHQVLRISKNAPFFQASAVGYLEIMWVLGWINWRCNTVTMISPLMKVTLLFFPKRPSQTCLHSPSPVFLSNHLPCHTGYILTPLYPRDKGGILPQNAGIRVQDYKV